ncbi:amidohydrolase [Annulohypoxylon maeteangense]|uniref:amidohydrolase n=1 Tax=Annulohypoxylon maeteangense TaxID=1927788 RepID=UPI00200800EE|nr:amidohydrolase [Annulohypoxylon maeteangense]KAI0886627.1 amidohydrolase [Annulohypoxylon maeteangense]
MKEREFEKGELPPYSAVAAPERRRRWPVRRSRGLRFVALACLAFIVYAQWRQIESSPRHIPISKLSADKLAEDLRVCSKLRSKPQDPIGLGRERNARYVDGHKPTLITNAWVWVGEPADGTSDEDAHAGKGFKWIEADVLLEYGLIKEVRKGIDAGSLPSDTLVWDAKGRQLTTGIIDMHSHAGVDSLPGLNGNDDTNEMGSNITPYVRSIDGINVFDHQIQVIKSGGVTTSLVLPGSSNNIGGEAYVIKHAVGIPDGRNETSITDLLADPERSWRYIKMACGENSKRTYGKAGEHGPTSRLGESWEFRHAFEQAAKLVQAQDDWCTLAESTGVERMSSYLPQDLEWETLSAVLRGHVHVNTHCYTVPDLEAFVDHTNEFKFPVRAFHHAHQTYLVPEVLKRAWGDSPPASALFADNMWYKAEAYIGSEYAGKVLYENGLTPIYVSDNPVLNAQHVVFEAAKSFGYGLPYHAALAAVTTAPAERLGLGQRVGKVKPGFDADIVVWDSDPLSVGAAPVQVWIDGTAQFDDPVELRKPVENLSDSLPEVAATSDEVTYASDVIITGVSKSFLSPAFQSGAHSQNSTVAISGGKITCVGVCEEELEIASKSGIKVISLQNGYLTRPFTVFGSLLGLNGIDAEKDTDNGGSPTVFSRGIDGLAFDTKKLHYAQKYGVTRAISAPKYSGQGTHQGTSVGFRTAAKHALDDGAIFADDVAVHYTLDLSAKRGSTSISNAINELRHKLLEAVAAGANTTTDPYTEAAFLAKVVDGKLPLVISVHSADAIAAILRVKQAVDNAITSSQRTGSGGIKLVLIGGAESFLLAEELAAADVGVVLSPLLSYRNGWDQRRALTGAPLTNGTAVDALVAAGVRTAVGIDEDWLVRDVGLLAGIAYKNGQGKLSEKDALDLVSDNVYEILGLNGGGNEDEREFVVFEGSPLEIGARVRAVGSGVDKEVMVFS